MICWISQLYFNFTFQGYIDDWTSKDCLNLMFFSCLWCHSWKFEGTIKTSSFETRCQSLSMIWKYVTRDLLILTSSKKIHTYLKEIVTKVQVSSCLISTKVKTAKFEFIFAIKPQRKGWGKISFCFNST